MIVVDTSVLYAMLDRRDAHHAAATTWYERTDEALATTPLVLAETYHLAAARAGRAAQAAFRADVAAGAYEVAWWREASGKAVTVAERHVDLGVDLTDASLVALAARLDTLRIATFDERHFRAIRPLTGGAAFVLAPADG